MIDYVINFQINQKNTYFLHLKKWSMTQICWKQQTRGRSIYMLRRRLLRCTLDGRQSSAQSWWFFFSVSCFHRRSLSPCFVIPWPYRIKLHSYFEAQKTLLPKHKSLNVQTKVVSIEGPPHTHTQMIRVALRCLSTLKKCVVGRHGYLIYKWGDVMHLGQPSTFCENFLPMITERFVRGNRQLDCQLRFYIHNIVKIGYTPRIPTLYYK